MFLKKKINKKEKKKRKKERKTAYMYNYHIQTENTNLNIKKKKKKKKWLSNLSILSVPDEGYSRNTSCVLNLISTVFCTLKATEKNAQHYYRSEAREQWRQESVV